MMKRSIRRGTFSRIFVLVFLMSFLSVYYLYCGSVTGTLKGIVKDEEGHPLENATITMQSKVKSIVKLTRITDEKGFYSFIGLPPDLFTFSIEKQDYVKTQGEIKIRAGFSLTQNFTLQSAESWARKMEGGEKHVVNFNRANDLFKKRKYAEALPLLNEAISEKSDMWQAHFLSALIKYNMKDYPGACEGFETVLSLQPGHEGSLYYIGMTAFKAGEKKKALDYFKRYLSIRSDSFEIANRLSVIYYNDSNYTEAINYSRKAIEINPGYGESYRILGLSLVQTGDIPAAIEALKKYVELTPEGGEDVEMAKQLVEAFGSVK
ncbi:MAG: tetratricopeptide repeat protein [Acidobacteriota bacterium]